MDRLSKELGGPEIWIKRDDCTGLSTGGNKTRKLAFLMAEAMGADTVMTQGATQSNHARQTAAYAAKLSLACHLLLEDRTGSNDVNDNTNGNVLLDHLHGATTSKRAGGMEMQAEMAATADNLRAGGRKVYLIPGGGSNATGAPGSINCAFELVSRANDCGRVIDHLVTATGRAGTQGQARGEHLQAGATDRPEAGLPGCRAAPRCGGGHQLCRPWLWQSARRHFGGDPDVCRTGGNPFGPGLFWQGAAGLIDYCRKGRFNKGARIVFLHTGGGGVVRL